MSLTRSTLFFVLWTLSFPAPGSPQPQDLRFEHITIHEGLSQNSVNVTLQDRTGFLWFGTGDGLNRYDGYGFEVLRSRPNDRKSLSDNHVRALYEDRAGALWVGTRSGGLNLYDPRQRTFRRYLHDPDDPQSLGHNRVWVIHEDLSGTLWVGTGGGGLARMDPSRSGRFTHLRHDPGEENSLSDNVVRSLYEGRDGTLWIGTGRGLDRLDPATGSITRYRPLAGQAGAADGLIRVIHEDRQNLFWLGTRDALVRFAPGSAPQSTYYYPPGAPSARSIWALHEGRDGVLWVGTYGGLFLFDPRTEVFTLQRHDPARLSSLSGDKVLSFFEDRSGAFWIGTYGGGINKLLRTGKAFTHTRRDADVPGQLSDNMIMSTYEDRAGIFWVGTANGGLNRLDRSSGAVTQYRADADDPRSLTRNDVRAVLEDREGRLWVGTEGGGLDRFEPATGTFVHYRHDPEDPRTLRDDDAWVLFEDREGTLWVGTYGGGLSRYDAEADAFTHHLHDPEDPNTLSHNIVRALHEDTGGSLWIGTGGGGLNRLDRATGRVERFRHDVEDPRSLSSNEVLCVYEDHAGTLWVGTHGGGLNRLLPSLAFRFYTQEDGLPSNVVYGILEDRQGFLWMSTNRGLSRFDARTETFRNYDASDGLQSNEFNTGAYFKSRRGEMFFGGINGITTFFPERIEENSYVPPVALTSFKKLDREVTPSVDLATLKTVTLRPDESVFSFEFAALSYVSSEKNQYAYRLLGFRDSWTMLGRKRDITFTNLDPGEYTFQVKASNNDGVWNEEGLAVVVIVEPPFWRTWWFESLAVLFGLGLVWLGTQQVQARNLRKHNLALQSEIAERRRAEEEREKLIARLESTNVELERFSYTVSHDLKAPLVTIKGFLGFVRKDFLAGDLERAAQDIDHIDRAVDKMRRLLTELLELSRAGRVIQKVETIALAPLAQEAVELLAGEIADRGVAIEVAPEMPAAQGDRARLLQVYQNLIGNAVKYMGEQPKPQVEVGARTEDGMVVCSVRDNGIGILPENLEQVFDLFHQVDPGHDGTGIGLAVVKRIVEVHGGKLWAESAGRGHGSAFYFSLPARVAASPARVALPS